MSAAEMSRPPRGAGAHPVCLVVVTAADLAASREFYAALFGWQMSPLSKELVACVTPAGPTVALRTGVPAGFPGIVPFLATANVDEALSAAIASGGAVERAKWRIPGVGEMARFKDPSGGVYGLTRGELASAGAPLPSPLGAGPKPPAGAISSLEMYAADFAMTARFFGERFAWGTLETIPGYMAFDPGAGVSGVFQSHTPSLPALAYIQVEDVRAKLTAIEAAGGRATGDPMVAPGLATFGYFTDASGTHMGLLGPA